MTSSPVLPLLQFLPASLLNIAPEKGQELHRLLVEHRVRFTVSDEKGWGFETRPVGDCHEIRASIRGMEMLWALSYAHYASYQKFKQHETGAAPVEVDLSADPALRGAFELLAWVLASHRDPAHRKPWPSDLPMPAGAGKVEDGEEPSPERVADELSLCAAAWILHHELGHVVAGDPLVTVSSRTEERTADRAATDWVLEGVTDEMMILKRGLGIAIAVVALAALELEAPPPPRSGAPTHPSAAERIHAALDHVAFGPDHQAFEFAAIALKVHLHRVGAELPAGEYDSAREMLDDLCGALYNWSRKRSA